MSENKESECLLKSDKNFLHFINRVIYGKVDQSAWRRQNESEEENNIPESVTKQFEFRSLNEC